MAVPTYSHSPGIYDNTNKDQKDVPGPSQPQPSLLKMNNVDSTSLKKAVENELLSLGRGMDRSRDQEQSVYLQFLNVVARIINRYTIEGIDLNQVYTLEDWHEMIVSQILPYTPTWHVELSEFLANDPPTDIQGWHFCMQKYLQFTIP